MKINNKKGQEEIMGFMLIVLLIVIIGFIFVFFLRPQEVDAGDSQVENLLYAITATTYDGQTISSRIGNCEKGIGCIELGEGLSDIMDAAFAGSGTVIGQNLRGYSLNMSGGVIYFVSEGNITGQRRGSGTVVSDTLIRLRFYY
ncbi:hypothetical protein ACFLZZ_03020 [Nanoarchaeota archaeon]